MPDYGWAYINLDALSTLNGPTGSLAFRNGSQELSGTAAFIYATASHKIGIGINVPGALTPATLPSYILDVSASVGDTTAFRTIGDIQVSGNAYVSGTLAVESLHAQTVISSSNLIVRDPLIGMGFGDGANETGSVGDRGLILGLAGDLNQAILWDQTSGSFVIGKVGAQGPDKTAFDIPDGNLSTVRLGYLTASNTVSASEYHGDGSKLTGLGASAVTSYTNAANNRIITSVDSSTINGEASLTFDGSMLKVTGNVSGSGTLQTAGNAFLGGNLNVTGTIKAPNLGADTDNTVVILNSSGLLKTDEADSRIFGSALVGTSGTPADNQLAIFTDANTAEGSSKLTFNGSILTLDASLSASGGIQVVGDSVFGGKLNVSSSAVFASSVSGSSTLEIVGNSTLGADVNISGTLKAAGDVKVSRKIIHDGDDDTLIDFTDDNIEFKVGNVKLLNLAEASDNVVTVGNGGDVDFQVKTENNNHTIFAEGSTDRIGLGTGTPQARLHMSQSSAYPTSMPKPLIKIEHVLDADSGGGGGPTTTPLLILTGTAPSGEDYAEGRVGINKEAPAGALHVVSKNSDCLVANDGRVAIGHSGPDTILDVRGENQIFRVVNSKNDSSTNMFFVSGAGENVGHFGSNATGVTLMVSGSSQLAGVTATTVSASSTLQAVGNAVIGGNLSVSGSINFSGGTIDDTTIGATTPAAVTMTAGSVKYRSKDNGDSPYSVVASDYIIGVDTSGGAVQVNLQAASAAGAGRMLIIKDIKGTAGTNNITIEPNGSEKIDRQSNMIIAANSGSVILFCDGTEYFIAGTR